MAENGAASDDLRSLLSQSFDDAMSSTAVSDGVVKPAADAGASDGDAGKSAASADDADAGKTGDDRPRGEDGKFKKADSADKDAKATDDKPGDDKSAKDAKADAKTDADKDGKKGEAKAADDKQADGKAATEGTAKEPPAHWTASDKAMFKLQPADVQDFLLRRHKAMEADYTKKIEAITDLKKEYEPVQQLFAPYVDVLKQKGLTPQTVIRRWADVETALASGKGVDIIDGLVKGYGIDKAQLAQRLGFTSTPPAAGSSDQQTQGDKAPAAGNDDPTEALLTKLEQRLAQKFQPALAKVEQWETTQLTAAQQAQKAREDAVEAEITSFKSATDKEGNLLHPYYDEVESAMIALAQHYVATKQPIPKIDALYDQAVWANPSTREALLATRQAAQVARANEEARAKAASARRAASSVTGAPGSGQATRPVRNDLDLRGQLEEAFAEISN
jgi:hypothetical protein